MSLLGYKVTAAPNGDMVGPLAAAAVAAESAKANAFFDQVFDEAVARSPMMMGALGIKKDMDQWDDISEARALEDFALTVQHLSLIHI